jgi:hypothetical protein
VKRRFAKNNKEKGVKRDLEKKNEVSIETSYFFLFANLTCRPCKLTAQANSCS